MMDMNFWVSSMAGVQMRRQGVVGCTSFTSPRVNPLLQPALRHTPEADKKRTARLGGAFALEL